MSIANSNQCGSTAEQSFLNTILPWLGWGVAALAGCFQFMLQTSTSVMIPGLRQAFDLDTFSVSLLSSSFFYTYLLCQIPAGMMIDYIKPRTTIITCQIIVAFLCILFASTSALWLATLSRILMGIFSAPAIISALSLACRTLPARYFALVAGLTEMLGMLGGVAGQALLARGIMYFGWRTSILLCAAIALVLAVLAFFFIRESEDMDEPQRPAKHIWQNLIAIMKMPQAWLNGIFCGLLFAVIAAFGSFWAIPFLIERYHISLASAADASSMLFIGAAIGTPIIGFLSERLQIRRPIMIFCTVGAIILTNIIFYINSVSLNQMFILLLLLGICSGAYLLPFAMMRDLTTPSMRGTAMGFTNMMCIIIGAPLIQPVIGWAVNHVTANNILLGYQLAFTLIPISLAAALVVSFLIKEQTS
jgi:MFS family permease